MLVGFLFVVQIRPDISPEKLRSLKQLWGIVSLLSLLMVTLLALLASFEREPRREEGMEEILEMLSRRSKQTRDLIEGIINQMESPAFVIEGGRVSFLNRAAEDVEELKPGRFDEKSLRERYLVEKIRITPGEHDAFLYILRDIEKEREKIREEEETRRLSSLGEIASFLSHEIKNSLSVILTLFKTGKKEGVYEEIERIRTLVDQFMEASRPLKPVLIRKKIDKTFFGRWENISVEGEAEAFVDPYLLELVFENIFKNSKEAGADRIEVKIAEKKASVLVEIKDNGIGIKKEEEEKIFLPFFSGKENGKGLGLFFVKKALLSMGGNIKAVSEQGGAKFLVNLKK